MDEVDQELLDLMSEGLLEMGIREDGEFYFWGTDKGRKILGLEPPRTIPA